MADYVATWITAALAAVQKYTPGLLPSGYDQFADSGKQYTGGTINFPAVWVMPARTLFDPEMQNAEHQEHTIQILLGVTGSTPDEVTETAMVYVKAVHQAILAAEAAGEFAPSKRVFVGSHDYGTLRGDRGGMLARFPEIELVVEAVET